LNIFVTGGAGFIGANFIYYELENHPDDRITCFDALTYAANLDNLAPVMDKITFIKGDIIDSAAVEAAFASTKPDIVVNFAAESHVDNSIKNPGLFLKTNVDGVGVLLDAAMRNGVRRFHQVSTDEVYGDLPLDRPELKFTENTPLSPSSPYSASKAASDLLVGAYIRTFGLDCTITRCSNNYGRFQFPEKLIPLMIKNAMSDLPLPVYGEGKNVRDWLFVEDHCSAIDTVMRKALKGSIYNVGGNNEMPNIEIVKLILEKTGKPESLITFVEDRKGHDLRYAIDSSKLQADLGWKPETAFSEGIERTIKEFKSSYVE
jgi:dTDP-glucose 4,6-dehydratase